MVMSDTPFTAALGDEHREPRRGGRWLAFPHSKELIEASDDDGIVIDHDGMALLNRVLVSAAL
jgi:hypothetical protein